MIISHEKQVQNETYGISRLVLPTSAGFMKACAVMGIRQSFTIYNNPKVNADTERFMRTLKEELVWLREWKSPSIFFEALNTWLEEYKTIICTRRSDINNKGRQERRFRL